VALNLVKYALRTCATFGFCHHLQHSNVEHFLSHKQHWLPWGSIGLTATEYHTCLTERGVQSVIQLLLLHVLSLLQLVATQGQYAVRRKPGSTRVNPNNNQHNSKAGGSRPSQSSFHDTLRQHLQVALNWDRPGSLLSGDGRRKSFFEQETYGWGTTARHDREQRKRVLQEEAQPQSVSQRIGSTMCLASQQKLIQQELWYRSSRGGGAAPTLTVGGHVPPGKGFGEPSALLGKQSRLARQEAARAADQGQLLEALCSDTEPKEEVEFADCLQTEVQTEEGSGSSVCLDGKPQEEQQQQKQQQQQHHQSSGFNSEQPFGPGMGFANPSVAAHAAASSCGGSLGVGLSSSRLWGGNDGVFEGVYLGAEAEVRGAVAHDPCASAAVKSPATPTRTVWDTGSSPSSSTVFTAAKSFPGAANLRDGAGEGVTVLGCHETGQATDADPEAPPLASQAAAAGAGAGGAVTGPEASSGPLATLQAVAAPGMQAPASAYAAASHRGHTEGVHQTGWDGARVRSSTRRQGSILQRARSMIGPAAEVQQSALEDTVLGSGAIYPRLSLVFDQLSLRAPGWKSDRLIVNDVSGQLVHSKLHAVMGPSGCGKTSLCVALAGQVAPKRVKGRVAVIRVDSPAAAAGERINAAWSTVGGSGTENGVQSGSATTYKWWARDEGKDVDAGGWSCSKSVQQPQQQRQQRQDVGGLRVKSVLQARRLERILQGLGGDGQQVLQLDGMQGVTCSVEDVRFLIGFVPQDDLLHGTLTVRTCDWGSRA
jgi:ABC-type cobalamin/Fe3+-siderophores transport system ATPase subunit